VLIGPSNSCLRKASEWYLLDRSSRMSMSPGNHEEIPTADWAYVVYPTVHR
jgi:hypothetical protein